MKRKLISLALVIVGLLAVVSSAPVYAAEPEIINQFPNQDNFDPKGAVMPEVANDYGDTSSLRIDYSSAIVYFSSPAGGTIYVNDFNHCMMEGSYDTKNNGIAPDRGRYDTLLAVYKLTENGSTVIQDQVGATRRNEIIKNSKSLSECTERVAISVSGLKPSRDAGHDDLYPVRVQLQVRPHYDDFVTGSRLPYMVNAFSIAASARAGGELPLITYDGSRGTGTPNPQFGIQDRSQRGTNRYRTFNIEFGSDCSITSPRSYNISWVDDDFETGVNWPPPGTSGPNIEFSVFEKKPGDADFHKIPISYRGEYDGNITPKGGNRTAQSASIIVNPGSQYYWQWRNVYDANGIQFTVPFDGIYYKRPCPRSTAQWNFEGTTTLPAGLTYVEPGTPVTWTHRVINEGRNTADRNVDGTLHQVVGTTETALSEGTRLAGTVTGRSGVAPVAWNINRSYTPTEADVGKDICQYMTWVPDNNTGSPAEGASARKCVRVERSPYLAVRNGDAFAGGSFLSAVTGTCPVQDRGFIGRATTNARRGSYGEYGLRALGSIDTFGSGGIKNGTKLSFANTPVPLLGRFDSGERCMTDYAAGKNVSLLTPAPTTPLNAWGDGTYYYDGKLVIDQPVTLGPGRKITVFVTGDVIIKKNIEFQNAGYGDIDSLPRLMIVTVPAGASTDGSIKVDNAVTRMDGYYQARQAFATCNADGPLEDDSAIPVARCNNSLVVNGVVVADRIVTRRTSNTGAGQDQPSEVFNYRPDLMLSLYDASRADEQIRTEGEVELPPRY